jgi:hypothetical protein
MVSAAPIATTFRSSASLDRYRSGRADPGELHVVKRYRLLDHDSAKAIEERNEKDNFAPPMVDNGIARDPDYAGKGLELELIIEDEGVFTMPWSASMIYWPPLMPVGRWPEITCVEGAKDYGNLRKPRCRQQIIL